ncbi:MAG: hypothetical protein NTY68_03420 [Candidatus Micrarchaeota archaeon]|nr:hypothetical protein [Candidatus Micrarchaeota archaeon]
MSRPIFFVDEMLNDLAVALRLSGFVSICKKWENDEALVSEAKASNGFILTSDKPLAERCEKGGIGAFLVPIKMDKKEKLVLVLKSAGIKEIYPETICTVCNGALEKAGKDKVVGNVPDTVLETFSEFLVCPDCKRVYWQGSHWKRIKAFLEEVSKEIAGI